MVVRWRRMRRVALPETDSGSRFLAWPDGIAGVRDCRCFGFVGNAVRVPANVSRRLARGSSEVARQRGAASRLRNVAGGGLRESPLHDRQPGCAPPHAEMSRHFRFYGTERRHRCLGCRTPDESYADSGSWPKAVCRRETTAGGEHLSACPIIGVRCCRHWPGAKSAVARSTRLQFMPGVRRRPACAGAAGRCARPIPAPGSAIRASRTCGRR